MPILGYNRLLELLPLISVQGAAAQPSAAIQAPMGVLREHSRRQPGMTAILYLFPPFLDVIITFYEVFGNFRDLVILLQAAAKNCTWRPLREEQANVSAHFWHERHYGAPNGPISDNLWAFYRCFRDYLVLFPTHRAARAHLLSRSCLLPAAPPRLLEKVTSR